MKTIKKIEILDHSIAYYDINEHNKQILLLIHGNSSSKDCFIPLLKHLTNFRIIAFDLFGHGNSAKPKNDECYSILSLSKLTSKFAEILDLNNFILAGHSLGGHVAIETIPLLEKRLRHVITWGTPPISNANDFQQAFLPNPLLAPMFKLDSTYEELETLACSYIHDQEHHKSFIDDYYKTDPQARILIFKLVAEGKHIDEIRVISNSPIPLTLLYAQNDALVNEKYIREVYEKASKQNNKLFFEKINSSHSSQIDNPKAISKIIKSIVAHQSSTPHLTAFGKISPKEIALQL